MYTKNCLKWIWKGYISLSLSLFPYIRYPHYVPHSPQTEDRSLTNLTQALTKAAKEECNIGIINDLSTIYCDDFTTLQHSAVLDISLDKVM